MKLMDRIDEAGAVYKVGLAVLVSLFFGYILSALAAGVVAALLQLLFGWPNAETESCFAVLSLMLLPFPLGRIIGVTAPSLLSSMREDVSELSAQNGTIGTGSS